MWEPYELDEPLRLADADDEQFAVLRAASTALRGLVQKIADVNPMFEMHRGRPPSVNPRTRDEALELLHSSVLAERHIRAELASFQLRWAIEAVLRGALVKDVAEALTVTSGAISKKWPDLSALRQSHLWFLDGDNAGIWVSSCLAVCAHRDSLVDATLDEFDGPRGPLPWLSSLTGVCTKYAEAAAEAGSATATSKWYDLVLHTPPMVEDLVNTKTSQAITAEASAALESLRLVWRAFRAGISVQDQIERDREYDVQQT